MIGLLRAHWKLALGALLLAVSVGSMLLARCRPQPTETAQTTTATVTTDTAEQKEVKQAITKRAKKVREEFRQDGTVAARTTSEVATDTKTDTQIVTVVKEVEKIKTVSVARRASPLGITATAEWAERNLRPSAYTLGADVPVGRVLGLNLRLGAAARWDVRPDRATDAKPDAALITVRVELP